MVAPSSASRVQRIGGMVVVLAQLGDPGRRESEVDQPLDAQQADQMGDAVLLVTVRMPIRHRQ
jgi:hypothetical protein